MGTLTRAELREEVKAGLGNRTNLDNRIDRSLNLAQQRLARIHDFDEMEVISETSIPYTGLDSDRYIQLPNLRELHSITILNGAESRKLIGRTSRWIDTHAPSPTYFTRDIPTYYARWGNWIELFPLPKQQYSSKFRWTRWPADLLEDGNVSQFVQKDEIIIELSLSYLYRSLGKEDDAAKHLQFAKDLLHEAKEVDRSDPDISIVPLPSTTDGQPPIVSPWLDPFNKG